MRRSKVLCVVCLLLVPVACEGPAGPRGATGKQGSPGGPGTKGAQGDDGAPGARGAQGPMGLAAAPSGLALEPNGLAGMVKDPSGQVVPRGRIVLVPTGDVAALAKQALDLTLSPADAATIEGDEPLEDLIDQNAASYLGASVSTDGSYRIADLAAGSYFVVFTPDPADGDHLPGGDRCRKAFDRASLVGTEFDVEVSGRPSDQATYVGSNACFDCHGRERSVRTAHRVSLSVPGVRADFQDTSPWPGFDAALAAFEHGTTLYYYACDASAARSNKCSVTDTDPTLSDPNAVVSFEAQLMRAPGVAMSDVGAFSVTLVNRSGSGSASYPVALGYGGALSRQTWLTRRTNADGSYSYYVLPLQYNLTGSTAYPSTDDWVWKDEHSEDFYDFDHKKLIDPGKQTAFDNNCAGCHLTGMELSGDANSGYHARAAATPNGDFDYDGDGRREEINIGCEGCHGPGSEHLEAKVRGLHIVSPSLLTPERETLICGRCHSRPAGLGAGGTETPLSSDGRMPRPGIRRSDYLTGFTARIDASADDLYPSGDSKSNHQQYTDFIRTAMYRNDSSLMTCASCHDPHGSDQNPHELLSSASDNSACTGCHSGSDFTTVRGHIGKVTTDPHTNVDDTLLLCTTCHMVRTAVSGARHPELLDKIPADATPVQYFHGDIASHRFEVTPRSAYAEQPIAGTSQCAFCHGTDFPNP